MKVHHLLFIAWLIVFAFWLARQFARYNQKVEQKRKM
jgi:hypothetical protein